MLLFVPMWHVEDRKTYIFIISYVKIVSINFRINANNLFNLDYKS